QASLKESELKTPKQTFPIQSPYEDIKTIRLLGVPIDSKGQLPPEELVPIVSKIRQQIISWA
ncbi:unnamed protein product, partial [Didymodactylos carnosus]